MIGYIWMDRNKIAAHNGDVVIVDCKDEGCVHRGVDQSQ